MLAKMLPPFVFSSDFTHQLGREGSRKPLKPTWGKKNRLVGSRGRDPVAGEAGPLGPQFMVGWEVVEKHSVTTSPGSDISIWEGLWQF